MDLGLLYWAILTPKLYSDRLSKAIIASTVVVA